MARIKNALTKFEIAPIESSGEAGAYMRLGKWIPTITDDTDEEIEEEGYYDGDGTPEDVVNGVKEKYTFEGTFDKEDAAQAYVKSIRYKDGDGRKVFLKVTDPDGATEEGKATITNIKIRGGEATEYPVFGCTISRIEKPKFTPAIGG